VIPELSNFEIYEQDLAYMKNEHHGVVTFIHCLNDFNREIVDWVQSLGAKRNNLYVNYYRLYSFCHYPDLFTDQFPNFTYVYKPELLFLHPHKYINFNDLPKIRKVKFEKTFCFLNNRSTKSRKELFNFFKDNQILDMSYASYNNVSNRGRYGARGKIEDEILQPYKNFLEDKVHTDIDPSIGNFYPVHNFLFDVCAETYCTENYIGLTEKSIKPFLWGYIPLIYGPPGTYQYLKNLGFDVFDNIIDTSFDNELNHGHRMWRFQQEVLRLSKISLTNYDIVQLESRFYNNRTVYLKNVQRCLNTINWIKQETNFLIANREQYLGF